MKYSININQLVLSKSTLDVIDATILDFLITFCNSKSPKIESKRVDGYTPIDYQYLIDEMPLLRIKARGALTPRIKRIEDEGYIQVKRMRNQSNFIKLTDKVDELFTKLNSSVHETEQVKPKAVHKTEPIIILDNHNTRSGSTAEAVQGSLINEVIEEFKEINPFYEEIYKNKTERTALNDLITKLGEEKVVGIIKSLKVSNTKRYAGTPITKPTELKRGLAKLIAFWQKERDNSKAKQIII